MKKKTYHQFYLPYLLTRYSIVMITEGMLTSWCQVMPLVTITESLLTKEKSGCMTNHYIKLHSN